MASSNTEQLLQEALERLAEKERELVRLSRKSFTLKSSYDYVIVGGGCSGAVVATRLSEDPNVSVLCIEAGPDDREFQNVKIPAKYTELQHTEVDWQRKTVSQSPHACLAMQGNQSSWPLGKMTGGCHSHNAMQYVRGNHGDYDRWVSEFGCEGWSAKEVLHYFKKSEGCEAPLSPEYHNMHGPIGISKTTPSEFDECFIKGLEEVGIAFNEDYNGEEQLGSSATQTFISQGERTSTANCLLWPAESRPNLDILLESHVLKILLNDTSTAATGVDIERTKTGEHITVSAKREVIVSAGTVHSPQILMLSGIGPRNHLEEVGIPCKVDLPVGEFLKDHLFFWHQNMTDYPTTDAMERDNLMTLAQWHLQRDGPLTTFVDVQLHGFFNTGERKDLEKLGIPDLQFYFWGSGDGESKEPTPEVNDFNYDPKKVDRTDWTDWKPHQFSWAPVLLHPKSAGNLKLASNNPHDSPLIDPKYLQHPDDIKTVVAGFSIMDKAMRSKSFKGYYGAPKPQARCSHEYATPEYWEWYARNYSLTIYHPIGTCKMGSTDQADVVVNPQLQVKGIPNLRVIDASIMPTLPSGNTCAPCVMIGEKGADMIKESNMSSRL